MSFLLLERCEWIKVKEFVIGAVVFALYLGEVHVKRLAISVCRVDRPSLLLSVVREIAGRNKE